MAQILFPQDFYKKNGESSYFWQSDGMINYEKPMRKHYLLVSIHWLDLLIQISYRISTKNIFNNDKHPVDFAYSIFKIHKDDKKSKKITIIEKT